MRLSAELKWKRVTTVALTLPSGETAASPRSAQPHASRAAVSSGSPTSAPSTSTSEWQHARTSVTAGGSSEGSRTSASAPASAGVEADAGRLEPPLRPPPPPPPPRALRPPLPLPLPPAVPPPLPPPPSTPAAAAAASARARSAASAAPAPGAAATPSSSRWSVVSVPVLSKQQTSTRPANGIRNGSVQNTRRLTSATSDALTAIVSSIGSSGGMTLVMIMTQLSSSLKRSRLGSCFYSWLWFSMRW